MTISLNAVIHAHTHIWLHQESSDPRERVYLVRQHVLGRREKKENNQQFRPVQTSLAALSSHCFKFPAMSSRIQSSHRTNEVRGNAALISSKKCKGVFTD